MEIQMWVECEKFKGVQNLDCKRYKICLKNLKMGSIIEIDVPYGDGVNEIVEAIENCAQNVEVLEP